MALYIALHGMEKALGIKYDRQGKNRGNRALVRYADDFVVLCKCKADAEQVIDILKEWLTIRGLSLSEEMTRIVHLTEGLDFLGFNIRLYSNVQRVRGVVRLITPSKEAVQRHRDEMRAEWLQLRAKPATKVVETLRPKIKGWANYYRHQVAAVTFHKMDHWMFIRECRYAKYTHPNKPTKWRENRYWGRLNPRRNECYVFGAKQTGAYLPKYAWTKIERYIKVKGTASPDDPSLKEYWK